MSSNWTAESLFRGLNSYKDIQTANTNNGVPAQGSYSRISSNSSKISKLAESSYAKHEGSTVSGSRNSLIGILAQSNYRTPTEGYSTVTGSRKSLIGNLAQSSYRMQDGSTVTGSSSSLIGKLA
ncbi:hypothetical protein L195_g057457, partial [Trifolium pratense]